MYLHWFMYRHTPRRFGTILHLPGSLAVESPSRPDPGFSAWERLGLTIWRSLEHMNWRFSVTLTNEQPTGYSTGWFSAYCLIFFMVGLCANNWFLVEAIVASFSPTVKKVGTDFTSSSVGLHSWWRIDIRSHVVSTCNGPYIYIYIYRAPKKRSWILLDSSPTLSIRCSETLTHNQLIYRLQLTPQWLRFR